MRPTWTDAELVAQLRAGDESAYEAIFRRHHPPLLSYCRHMLGGQDEAEDALQQAFIRAHRALLSGPSPRELRPWLYAIARNCCRTALAARRPESALDGEEPSLEGLVDLVARREELRELVADLARLPEEQRSALLLAELEDLSHVEIAEILGCRAGKVKALVYQARAGLLADRAAREASCREIREELAVARGGELRRGPLRRHLRICLGCREFQRAVGAQRQSLAIVLPVAASAGLGAKTAAHVAGAHTASAMVAGALTTPGAATSLGGGLPGGVAGLGGAASGGAGATASAGAVVSTGAGTFAAGGAAASASTMATAGVTATATASTLATAGATATASTLATATAGATATASTLATAGATATASTLATATTGAAIGGGVLAKLAVGGVVASLATAGALTAPHHHRAAARLASGTPVAARVASAKPLRHRLRTVAFRSRTARVTSRRLVRRATLVGGAAVRPHRKHAAAPRAAARRAANAAAPDPRQHVGALGEAPDKRPTGEPGTGVGKPRGEQVTRPRTPDGEQPTRPRKPHGKGAARAAAATPSPAASRLPRRTGGPAQKPKPARHGPPAATPRPTRHPGKAKARARVRRAHRQ